MSEPHTHKKPKPHRPRRECCVDSECLSGLRNNYFIGKRLTPDAFLVEQNYLNGRRQLLNRAIHGWGVVYGYAVTTAGGRIVIGSGLALDAVGRELVWVEDTELELGDVIALDDTGALVPQEGTLPFAHQGCWLLSVHYAEQRVAPLTVKDPCTCERTQWDRICETARFTLRYVDCAKCCEEPRCELRCDCGTGPCCDERHRDERARDVENPVLRGGCQCLCEHLTHLTLGVECKGLTEIVEPCGHVYVDLHNGVPLACLRVTPDDCGSWKFDEWIDACGPRRLVRRNDLLFDLIRGCDLTRIVEVGWEDFHRRPKTAGGSAGSQPALVEWGEFEKSWGTYVKGVKDQTTELYWVKFSRPVRANTVRPDCFAITVIEGEEEGGWGNMLRVPITAVLTEPVSSPPGHVIKATIQVDAEWMRDAILSEKNRFNYQEALVEVEVRGDYIIDCNGQAVDAEAVGLLAVPTGDGAPGGRYLSSFRVAPRLGRKS